MELRKRKHSPDSTERTASPLLLSTTQSGNSPSSTTQYSDLDSLVDGECLGIGFATILRCSPSVVGKRQIQASVILHELGE